MSKKIKITKEYIDNQLLAVFFAFNAAVLFCLSMFFIGGAGLMVSMLPRPDLIDYSAIWNIPLLAEFLHRDIFYGTFTIITLIVSILLLVVAKHWFGLSMDYCDESVEKQIKKRDKNDS